MADDPVPAEAPPAETADEAAKPAKPARKRKAKAATEPEPTEPEAAPVAVPAANNDTAVEESDEPRRSGWWQKTFG